jgi:hypothetical protein
MYHRLSKRRESITENRKVRAQATKKVKEKGGDGDDGVCGTSKEATRTKGVAYLFLGGAAVRSSRVYSL